MSHRNTIYLLLIFILTEMSMISCSVKESNSSKVGHDNNFAGKRVAVLTGSTQDIYAQKHLKSSTLIQVTSPTDLILNIKTGKADIGLAEENLLNIIMPKNKELVIINDSIYASPVGIAFSKDKIELRDQFNAFLTKIRKSGLFEQIYRRWIGNTKTLQMPNIPNKGTSGIIELHTDATLMPFSFIRDDKLSGLDIELMERFAASLNKKLDINISNFSGVVQAISLRQADVAACCITITPERAKQIAFSDPYYFGKTCAFGIDKKFVTKETSFIDFINKSADSFKQNFIDEHRYKMIGNGLLCTIEITVFTVIIGTILGVLICFIRMRKSKIWQGIAKIYIQLFRGIPQVVLLMLLFYVIFASTNMNGITVSIIGFSFIFAAYVSEMFRTTIENISYGQVEAGLSMGFTPFQTFYYVILPLTIRRVLPIYKGEVTGLIKSTSIVGYITVQDLTKISDMIRSATFDAFMPLILITIIYFFIIWLFSLLLKAVEIKYVPKVSRFK